MKNDQTSTMASAVVAVRTGLRGGRALLTCRKSGSQQVEY